MAGSQGFRWRAAPRLHRLATVSLLGVIAAVATGHAALLLLAAPALAALAVSRARGGPATIDLAAATSAARCFEGEPVELTVTLAAPQPLDDIAFTLEPGSTIGLLDGQPAQAAVRTDRAAARWVLQPEAWGRRAPGTVSVRCRYGGIWQADVELSPAVLEVFPHPPPARAWLVPADLRRRIGEHPARAAGGGVEFAGIREYLPGDRLRDLNWAVSSRRGRLHTNQRAPEWAADIILMIDGFSDVGPTGDGTIDVAVRGAAAVATAYLRAGDRVGVVALGGMLRWLSPGAGHAQFYRIAEMVFDVRNESVVTPDLDRIPRTALPPGALVIVFSPLLDERAIGAIADLRERGFAPVVVDVLRHEPPVVARSGLSALALRLWRLDRAALRASLGGLGVPVVIWDSDDGLDAALAPLRRIPVSARRP
jgi:uncharacterized protein (DUF58 family)